MLKCELKAIGLGQDAMEVIYEHFYEFSGPTQCLSVFLDSECCGKRGIIEIFRPHEHITLALLDLPRGVFP